MKWNSEYISSIGAQYSLNFLHCCYTVNWFTNLDPMELKSNHTPVLTDTAPISITKSILGVHSSLLPYSPTGATIPHGMLLNIPRKKTGILEDVRSSGWLDAMKSSSPPPKKITKDVSHGFASSEADVAYFTWLVLHTSLWVCFWILQFWGFIDAISLSILLISQLKYPSALTSFEQITNYAKGKRIALFLDYDGTLSPIVDNPDCAFMSDNVCNILLGFRVQNFSWDSPLFSFLFCWFLLSNLCRCVLLLKRWQSIFRQQ